MTIDVPAGVAARSVRVSRTIECPRDAVFDAWTDPEKLRAWWGGDIGRTVSADVDLRVHGSYRLTMQAGEQVGTISGVYVEVERPERLVYTWRWDNEASRQSLVTVDFLDVDAATEVVVTHEGLENIESLAFHQGGWCASLEGLHQLLVAG